MWFAKLKDGPIKKECLKIARKLLVDELVRQGIIVEFVTASEIDKGVREFLACDEEENVLREARENLKARRKQ